MQRSHKNTILRNRKVIRNREITSKCNQWLKKCSSKLQVSENTNLSHSKVLNSGANLTKRVARYQKLVLRRLCTGFILPNSFDWLRTSHLLGFLKDWPQFTNCFYPFFLAFIKHSRMSIKFVKEWILRPVNHIIKHTVTANTTQISFFTPI